MASAAPRLPRAAALAGWINLELPRSDESLARLLPVLLFLFCGEPQKVFDMAEIRAIAEAARIFRDAGGNWHLMKRGAPPALEDWSEQNEV
jgi:hypothetical protein